MRPVFFALLIACGSDAATTTTTTTTTTPPTQPVATAPSDTAAYAAVLLHEIKSGSVTADEVVCIRVRGVTDPGDIIIAVMKTYPSAFDGAGCTGGGFDPVVGPNGEPAVMFDVGPLVRDAMGIRMKGGGAHRGGGSAREIEYTLESDGDSFRVVSEKVLLTT